MATSSVLVFFLAMHHLADRSREYDALLDKENAKLVMASNLIRFHLNEVISGMAVMAKDSLVQETLLHPSPANRQSLLLDLSPYVEQPEQPDEITLLDRQGAEIVHVAASHAIRTPLKKMRPLLEKALPLGKNQVYLAPFPQTGSANAASVLYIAVPVFRQDTRTGTLLAAYTARQFKHVLDDVLGPTLGHIAILNDAGNTIYDRQTGAEKSCELWNPEHFPHSRPRLWKQVLSSPADKIDEGNGWLLYTTIDLAQSRFLRDTVDAVIDHSARTPNDRPEWKIVSMIPASALSSAWESRLRENLPLYFLMFGGTGLFAWQRAQRRQDAKLAEETLKASRDVLVTVLDSMEASVYVTDMHSYEILFANRHLCRTLSKSNLVGKLCWRELRPGQTDPCANCGNVELLESAHGTLTREYQNPANGRWLQVRVNAVRWVDGRIVRMEIATDITEQKESLALRNARKLALEQTSRFNIAEEMASGLAHELSQPLSAAHNYLDACLRLAENSPLDAEKLRQGLRLAHLQTERAGKIVSHIKDTIRRRGNERGAKDITRLARETVEYLEYEIRHNDIDVHFDLAPGTFIAYVNGIEIEQVLLNLMRNAIDSMQGSSPRRLGVSSHLTPGGDILVAISDTGKGVAHADLDFIFNPFLTTKNDGLGLGLTICRTIVESYGGRIWAESPVGQGATFCFTLPGENSHE